MARKNKEPKPPLWLRIAWKTITKRFKKTTQIPIDDMSDNLPQEGEYGIKETVEAAVGVKHFLQGLNRALADGKLGFSDIGYFLAAQNSIMAAVEDANMIRKEAKDLQRAEAVVLAGYLYDLIDEILALTKKEEPQPD